MRRPRRLPSLTDFTTFATLFELRTVSRWVGLGLATGIVAGLGAALFFLGMQWVRHIVLDGWANLPAVEPRGEHSLFEGAVAGHVRWWMVAVAPALGGLVSGLIVSRFAPEAEGHGTDEIIHSFHYHGGRIRARVPLVKMIASIVILGTGGSAGREGPIAQIGAGFGSLIAKPLGLTQREQQLMLVAGAAGGIGAIFRSPLGGALFLVEVLYRDDFEVDALVPAVLSSVVAYSVYTMVFPAGTIFAVEHRYVFDPRQLPFYLLMAVGASLVGVLYIKVFYGMRDHMFRPMKIPPYLKPMLGGLGIGLLALVVPQALGAGYGWLQEALLPTGRLPLGWIGAGALLGIALLKVATTSLSISSGGSGGVFGPSVVIGGMVGGAFGVAFHQLVPHIVPQPGAFVLVGMACFFGGVAHVPISSLVMASEMTGSYDLLVPLMLTEAVTFVMVRRWTLYEKQVPSRRDSPAHGGEYVLDLLQDISVRGVYDRDATVMRVEASTPLERLLRHASESSQAVFPVMTPDNRIEGVVTLDTLREFFFDQDIGKLAIAADCEMPLVYVTEEDTMGTALERFASSHYPQLPVVSADDPNRIVGLLGYDALLQAYSRELVRRRIDTGPRVEPQASHRGAQA